MGKNAEMSRAEGRSVLKTWFRDMLRRLLRRGGREGIRAQRPVLMGRRFVEGSEYGWFAYPSGTEHVEDAQGDLVIRRVDLEQDDYGGPFWSDAGHIGEDFEYLHRVLGISRELYHDAMAWNYGDPYGTRESSDVSARDDFKQQQELIRRLGEEVHPGIHVDPPRAAPPIPVSLMRLNGDVDGSARLLLWDEAAVESGRVTLLPDTPQELNARLLAWVAEAWKYDHGTDENRDQLFAWQDEGSALAQELQAAIGPGYRVTF